MAAPGVIIRAEFAFGARPPAIKSTADLAAFVFACEGIALHPVGPQFPWHFRVASREEATKLTSGPCKLTALRPFVKVTFELVDNVPGTSMAPAQTPVAPSTMPKQTAQDDIFTNSSASSEDEDDINATNDANNRWPRTIHIFHDAENCYVPNNSAVNGSLLFDLVVREALRLFLGSPVDDKIDIGTIDVRWTLVLNRVPGNKYHIHTNTLGQLQDRNVTHVSPSDKKDAVDMKIKDVIFQLIDDGRRFRRAERTNTLVVLLSGDRDFSSELKRLRNHHFSVVAVHRPFARPSFLDTIRIGTGANSRRMDSDRWDDIISACTGGPLNHGQAPAPLASTQAATAGNVVYERFITFPVYLYFQKFGMNEMKAAMSRYTITLDLKADAIRLLPQGGPLSNDARREASEALDRFLEAVRVEQPVDVRGVSQDDIKANSALLKEAGQRGIFLFTTTHGAAFPTPDTNAKKQQAAPGGLDTESVSSKVILVTINTDDVETRLKEVRDLVRQMGWGQEIIRVKDTWKFNLLRDRSVPQSTPGAFLQKLAQQYTVAIELSDTRDDTVSAGTSRGRGSVRGRGPTAQPAKLRTKVTVTGLLHNVANVVQAVQTALEGAVTMRIPIPEEKWRDGLLGQLVRIRNESCGRSTMPAAVGRATAQVKTGNDDAMGPSTGSLCIFVPYKALTDAPASDREVRITALPDDANAAAIAYALLSTAVDQYSVGAQPIPPSTRTDAGANTRKRIGEDDHVIVRGLIDRMDACMPHFNSFEMTPEIVAAISGRTRECAALLRQCISDCDGLARKIGLETSGLAESRKRLGDKAEDARDFAVYFPIYGAVKAGKSTLLSCLTRSSILPSRPLPMTTIPIKILHKSGTDGISLVIPNAEQWNGCIADVVRTKTLPTVSADKDHPEHVKTVFSKAKEGLLRFKTGILRDAEAIADELMLLSDVARLCFLLGVDLDKYNIDLSLEHLPLITMDIAIFRNLGVDRPFYLVDTPGPNEARLSTALEKINQRVLEESDSALAVVPYNQIESRDVSVIMGNVVHTCAEQGKRLLVAVNQVDSMTNREKELPAVIEQLRKNMGTFDNYEVIPVAASRIKMMCELQAELDSGRAGFAESKIWTDVVEAMGINTDQLDVKEYARKLIPQELETYNAVELVRAVKSIYLDSDAIALKKRVDELTPVCNALAEFGKQIETSMKGAEEQVRKLAEITAVIDGVRHFQKTVAHVRPTLEKELRAIFNRLRESFVVWSKTQEWIIVDGDTKKRIEQTSFSNVHKARAWSATQGEAKLMPRVTKKFNEFVEDVLREVPDAVDTQWATITELTGKIDGLIGQEADAMVFTYRAPPTLYFAKPDIAFDVKAMGIPLHDNGDKTVTIITNELTEAILRYFIQQSSMYADAALARFEESLATVLVKFEDAATRFKNQADDMMKVQKELQTKAHLHATELRDFVTRVTGTIEMAHLKTEALNAELDSVARKNRQ